MGTVHQLSAGKGFNVNAPVDVRRLFAVVQGVRVVHCANNTVDTVADDIVG